MKSSLCVDCCSSLKYALNPPLLIHCDKNLMGLLVDKLNEVMIVISNVIYKQKPLHNKI